MRLAFTLLNLTFLLAACSSTSNNVKNPPGNSASVTPLSLLWSITDAKTGGNTYLEGNLIFTGNQLRAIDIRGRRSAFSLGARIDSGRTSLISLDKNLLLVERRPSNQMLIIDQAGKILNTIIFPEVGGVSLGQQGPYILGNALYVGSGPTVYRYSVNSLKMPGVQPIWVKTFEGLSISSLLATDENHVYVGTDGVRNQLVALDGQGNERWKVQLAPPGETVSAAYTLGLYNDNIITQAGVGGLQAYNAQTGQRAWNTFPSVDVCPSGASPAENDMTIADNKIFFGHTGGHCVLAFHADTGKLAWIFDAPNPVTFATKPLYLNGVVYASNSKLWALNAESGQPLAVSSEIVGDNAGSPLNYDPVEKQVLYWGTTGLYSYKPVR